MGKKITGSGIQQSLSVPRARKPQTCTRSTQTVQSYPPSIRCNIQIAQKMPTPKAKNCKLFARNFFFDIRMTLAASSTVFQLGLSSSFVCTCIDFWCFDV